MCVSICICLVCVTPRLDSIFMISGVIADEHLHASLDLFAADELFFFHSFSPGFFFVDAHLLSSIFLFSFNIYIYNFFCVYTSASREIRANKDTHTRTKMFRSTYTFAFSEIPNVRRLCLRSELGHICNVKVLSPSFLS